MEMSPQFTLRTCTVHEVKVYPCAINSPGETTPITQAHVQELLDEVNVIYRQVGLHFSLGAPLVKRVNDEWDEYGLVDKRIGRRIRSELHDTGGIEVYFIKGRGNESYRGQSEPFGNNTEYGIIIKNTSTARALAHEIGHACGWCDIYAERKGVDAYDFDDFGLKRSWLPGDWSNGTGGLYYPTFLTHRVLIKRLLMYGVGDGEHLDLPRGNVYGISKDTARDLLNVGRMGICTTNPSHL